MTEVTQADRDAAARYEQLLVVSEPVETIAQSFARHRQQAVAAEVALIVAWLREQSQQTLTSQWHCAFVASAQAIERGEYKETSGE